MQYHAIQCNTMQYHAIPCNTMQYHAILCNTMQYHASLITANGAYHFPVGSIMAIFSSVRSSNSHPDLIVTQQHPTFSDQTGPKQQLTHSEPSGDDLGTTLAKLGKTLSYSGILWHTLAYSGILWHTTAYPNILWHALAYSGIIWHTLAYSGILWHTLAYSP